MGKKRYVGMNGCTRVCARFVLMFSDAAGCLASPAAPHVVYQTGKKPEEPCSITTSLSYFPEEDRGEANVTSPPRNAPSNLTVVTVEGCPSFVILDWQKTDNDTTGTDL